MEFSLNYTLKRFEDTETEDGKSKEQFAEDIKDKTNIVMMTDEEYKEYIKAKRLYRVIKKEEL